MNPRQIATPRPFAFQSVELLEDVLAVGLRHAWAAVRHPRGGSEEDGELAAFRAALFLTDASEHCVRVDVGASAGHES
jgi:hypothetical protein